jgi:hypothetical protein
MSSKLHRAGWGAIAALGGVFGCAQFHAQPYPLYGEPVQPSERIATLSGPIGVVDGKNVAKRGSLFALLPGCHVVSLRKEMSEGGLGGAWSIELPEHTYVFHMQAGHTYEIQALRQSSVGAGSAVSTVGNATSAGGVKIEAVDRDAHGKILGLVAPVRSQAEMQACAAEPDTE